MFDVLIISVCAVVIVATIAMMYLSRREYVATETKTIVVASSLKVGDRIITPKGEAMVRRTTKQKIKIPARTEESIVMGVNYANSASGDKPWTVGTDNVQVWTHDKVTKVVPPGFLRKARAFVSQV